MNVSLAVRCEAGAVSYLTWFPSRKGGTKNATESPTSCLAERTMCIRINDGAGRMIQSVGSGYLCNGFGGIPKFGEKTIRDRGLSVLGMEQARKAQRGFADLEGSSLGLFRSRRQRTCGSEAAIDAWGDAVLRLAFRLTANRSDAEDVFQSVFTSLLSCKTAPREDRELRRWLLAMTVRCSYDVLRRRGTAVSLDQISQWRSPDALSDEDTPLEAAVESLPPAMRAAIHLYYYEGYSTEEIAEMIGEKPSTVRSHLHRARKALNISLERADHGRE